MTEGDREPDAVAPDAASVERLQGYLEERARRADERDRVADQREATADERDQLADERERIADIRESQLSQAQAHARAPRSGVVPRRRREKLEQARQANERDLARIDRLEAGLAREDADRDRQAAKLEYDTTRNELEDDNPDRTR